MAIEYFQVDGWLPPIGFGGIGEMSSCGNSVGMPILPDDNPGGGVMDYNEVARLHAFLGEWLRWAETSGVYKKTRKWHDVRMEEYRKQQASRK